MSFDNHKNFGYSAVAVAPSPASSGTSLTVVVTQGARFPSPPFNATVWPIAVLPVGANAEIIRVTGIVGDTLTILRTQEGSASRSILLGDQIAATVTAKTLTDVEVATPLAQSVSFSAAQLQALNGAPLTAITGVVGKTILLVGTLAVYNFVTTPYSGTTDGLLLLAYGAVGDDEHYCAFWNTAGFLDQTSSRSAPWTGGGGPMAGAVGAAMQLSLSSYSGGSPVALTAGDGTLTLNFFYYLV